MKSYEFIWSLRVPQKSLINHTMPWLQSRALLADPRHKLLVMKHIHRVKILGDSWSKWWYIFHEAYGIWYWYLVGGFNPSENISQLGWHWLCSIYGKIKNVRNHQPDMMFPPNISTLPWVAAWVKLLGGFCHGMTRWYWNWIGWNWIRAIAPPEHHTENTEIQHKWGNRDIKLQTWGLK